MRMPWFGSGRHFGDGGFELLAQRSGTVQSV
jgi:hypothetical protein